MIAPFRHMHNCSPSRSASTRKSRAALLFGPSVIGSVKWHLQLRLALNISELNLELRRLICQIRALAAMPQKQQI